MVTTPELLAQIDDTSRNLPCVMSISRLECALSRTQLPHIARTVALASRSPAVRSIPLKHNVMIGSSRASPRPLRNDHSRITDRVKGKSLDATRLFGWALVSKHAGEREAKFVPSRQRRYPSGPRSPPDRNREHLPQHSRSRVLVPTREIPGPRHKDEKGHGLAVRASTDVQAQTKLQWLREPSSPAISAAGPCAHASCLPSIAFETAKGTARPPHQDIAQLSVRRTDIASAGRTSRLRLAPTQFERLIHIISSYGALAKNNRLAV